MNMCVRVWRVLLLQHSGNGKTLKCHARTTTGVPIEPKPKISHPIVFFYTNVNLNKEISSIDVPKAKDVCIAKKTKAKMEKKKKEAEK